jgi:hypothetical protein
MRSLASISVPMISSFSTSYKGDQQERKVTTGHMEAEWPSPYLDVPKNGFPGVSSCRQTLLDTSICLEVILLLIHELKPKIQQDCIVQQHKLYHDCVH